VAHAFDEEIVFAVEALRRGEIVAFPTETFYALGVDALDELALARLRQLKGRKEKAISVLVDGPEMLDRLVSKVSPRAAELMRGHWPGALTLALPARRGLPAPLVSVHRRPAVAPPDGPGAGLPVRASDHRHQRQQGRGAADDDGGGRRRGLRGALPRPAWRDHARWPAEHARARAGRQGGDTAPRRNRPHRLIAPGPDRARAGPELCERKIRPA